MKLNDTIKHFIMDTLERATKTFAEMMLADISVGQGFGDIDWGRTLSASGVAALISVLMSIASYRVGDKNASLVDTN